MLYDLEAKRQTQVFGRRGSYPTWSPDGQFLYFATTGEDQAWWRFRLRDRRPERIANVAELGLRTDFFFSVSPHGIIITSRDLTSSQIYGLEWKAP
jgi:Tol biopolymer transport system component